MWARALAVAAGLWLMCAPAVLDYGDAAATSDRIAGPVGAAFAFVSAWAVVRALRWVQLPVAVWLAVAPLVLDMPADATVSSLAVAVVFAATAFVRGDVEQTFGGGWRSLREPLPGREVSESDGGEPSSARA